MNDYIAKNGYVVTCNQFLERWGIDKLFVFTNVGNQWSDNIEDAFIYTEQYQAFNKLQTIYGETKAVYDYDVAKVMFQEEGKRFGRKPQALKKRKISVGEHRRAKSGHVDGNMPEINERLRVIIDLPSIIL